MKGDCETISRLMEEKVRLEQRSVMLDRLLFEVSRKFPCETRFDTALRYIREAEARANETGQAQSAVPFDKSYAARGQHNKSESVQQSKGLR